VLFRTKRFCRASCRPVSHPDAQRFRWVTILHVYLPALAVLPVAHWANPNMLRDAVEETSGWFVTLVGAWVLPTLLVLTGLPSYLFHPRRLTTAQQNRAVALSYYGTAPLGLLAPLAAAAVGTLAFADHLRGEPGAVVGLSVSFATLVSCVALGTWYWATLAGIAQRVLRSAWATARVALLVPLLWVLGGSLVLVAFPLCVYFLAIVFYSLRGNGPGS